MIGTSCSTASRLPPAISVHLIWHAGGCCWPGGRWRARQTAATPKRGGILEFAVDAEPGNYDCHANISFAFLHPVAPHYSTLLKFDGANYPQVKGDLAESWSVSADKLHLYVQAAGRMCCSTMARGSPRPTSRRATSGSRIRPRASSRRARSTIPRSTAIDTPDPLTVVFHLKWPEAAMLANFASPWNCIYSAARSSPRIRSFPKTHVLGTGPFTFVEHVKGDHWTGKRFDKYFLPGPALSRRLQGAIS